MRTLSIVRTFLLIGLTGALGACGDSESTPKSAGPALRGVIASASDCTSFGPGAVEACTTAIDTAIAAHESGASKYSSLADCEKALGQGRCERGETGHYRIRLSAFMVSLGASPYGEPLYPAKDGAVGFQSARQDTYLASDHSVAFSRLALSVAETQAAETDTKKGRKRKL